MKGHPSQLTQVAIKHAQNQEQEMALAVVRFHKIRTDLSNAWQHLGEHTDVKCTMLRDGEVPQSRRADGGVQWIRLSSLCRGAPAGSHQGVRYAGVPRKSALRQRRKREQRLY